MLHSLQPNLPVISPPACTAISKNMDLVIPLKQVKSCLLNTTMGLNPIQNCLFPLFMSLQILLYLGGQHRKICFFVCCSILMCFCDFCNFIESLAKGSWILLGNKKGNFQHFACQSHHLADMYHEWNLVHALYEDSLDVTLHKDSFFGYNSSDIAFHRLGQVVILYN